MCNILKAFFVYLMVDPDSSLLTRNCYGWAKLNVSRKIREIYEIIQAKLNNTMFKTFINLLYQLLKSKYSYETHYQRKI